MVEETRQIDDQDGGWGRRKMAGEPDSLGNGHPDSWWSGYETQDTNEQGSNKRSSQISSKSRISTSGAPTALFLDPIKTESLNFF